MNKGIFFDLDGTLWNASKGTLKAANIILRNNNLSPIDSDVIDGCMGLSKKETAKKYIEELKGKKRDEVFEEIESYRVDYLKDKGAFIYPGVKKTLKKLKENGFILGIVTNSAEMEYVEDFFNQSGTSEYFDGYIAAGSYDLTKKQAIKKLKEDLHIDEIVYVGDTIMDEEAARGVCPFVHCKYGYGKAQKPDYKIKCFEDLLKISEKF